MLTLKGERYYRADEMPASYQRFKSGYHTVVQNPLFQMIPAVINVKTSHLDGKGSSSCVLKNGNINVNFHANLTSKEWAFVIAHNLLHLIFGHFDKEKIPEDAAFIPSIWNKACDIYVSRFLYDMGFGAPICPDPAGAFSIKLNDEAKIYEYLLKNDVGTAQDYGTNSPERMDMIGLDSPITYENGRHNPYSAWFAKSVEYTMKEALIKAGDHDWNKKSKETPVTRAASWFLSKYPLLGGLAASFKIYEDVTYCQRNDIHIAAVDISLGEIYINPSCKLSDQEWRFVLAHEFLHAGLCHHKRCAGRDPYLWNVACDFVINDWLREMQIGSMPAEGILYDESLHGMSAESIYDLIVKEMRKYKKEATFRGFGKGDILKDGSPGLGRPLGSSGTFVTLDDFFKNALREGLDYHIGTNRGFLPAGLVEEIRALTQPAIPWEVELAEWFDINFPPIEKHRSYARSSRRQGSTPDIPRPSYIIRDEDRDSRTFGVLIDTSGSMSVKMLGMALGAIASYAVAKEVPFVRIVFCDAEATDAGYISPEDIAGRVEVTGRGGTILQPGIKMLETAKDFPKNGPILIITDGYIEEDLKIKREHAFLIPKGNKLPFKPKGRVFYFK